MSKLEINPRRELGKRDFAGGAPKSTLSLESVQAVSGGVFIDKSSHHSYKESYLQGQSVIF